MLTVFLLDLPNFLLLLVFIQLCYFYKLIPSWLAFVLSILSATPFFLNNVLFPSSFMPDQYRYFEYVKSLRSGIFNVEESRTIEFSGALLFLVPLPLIETVNSLGFYNRFIANALIIWLYASKKVRGFPLVFILFFPSFVLYSSLALRDLLIFSFMLLSVVLYIDNKKAWAVIFATPLFFIKFQNFFLLLVFAIIHEGLKRGLINIRIILVLGSFIALFFILFSVQVLELINFYRRAMHFEDGGVEGSLEYIDSYYELIIFGIPSSVMFLMSPLPWNAHGVLQIIQSMENVLIFLILVFIFKTGFKQNTIIGLKWLIFLIASFVIYGLVVSNYGTAARYKFPFVLLVIVGMAYELRISRNLVTASASEAKNKARSMLRKLRHRVGP